MSSLSRGRVGAMFKSGMRNVKARRASAATETLFSPEHAQPFNPNSSALSSASVAEKDTPLPPIPVGGFDFHYLQTPNLPFDPDFSVAFATLADVLIEAYAGLLTLLPGPENCGPGTGEAYSKADKMIRKILLGGIVNELGEHTRASAKNEVGGVGKLVLGGLM